MSALFEKVLLLGIIFAALVVFVSLAVFCANVLVRFIKDKRNANRPRRPHV